MTSTAPSAVDRRLVVLHAGGAAQADPWVVGAKAANLVRLADAGLPVPPGFVLGTEVCAGYRAHHQLGPEVAALLDVGVAHVERDTGRRFGAPRRPLLVSVRSGAPVSMPGMLDTVLDVGLCDATVAGLLRASGDPAFVWDSYRRLVQGYGEIVDGCPPAAFDAELDAVVRQHGVPDVSELDVASLRELVARLLAAYRSAAGRPFPQDPRRQLEQAVEAVLRSWDSERAVEYRRLQGVPDLPGTAVTVQAMVFGNLGSRSGSGVAFTRDPATGAHQMYVDFLPAAQGEDVVGGRRAATGSPPLVATVPRLDRQLESVGATLEELFADAQDFEFTVEDGELWLLQTRSAKRTPLAALQIACDLVDEGLIDPGVAVDRLSGYDLETIVVLRLEGEPGVRPAGHATPASAGVAAGAVALDVDAARRLAGQGQDAILVRGTASTADVAALAACRGLLTATGSRTSHAAVVARQLGVVCLVGCPDLSIDLDARQFRLGGRLFRESGTITIDGSSGLVYPGALRLVEHRPTALIDRVRAWRGARR